MTTQVRLSKKFSIGIPDFVRSAIIAGLSAALAVAGTSIEAWINDTTVLINWGLIAKIGIGATAAYLIKNFFEPAKVITTVASNEKAVEVKAEINKAI